MDANLALPLTAMAVFGKIAMFPKHLLRDCVAAYCIEKPRRGCIAACILGKIDDGVGFAVAAMERSLPLRGMQEIGNLKRYVGSVRRHVRAGRCFPLLGLGSLVMKLWYRAGFGECLVRRQ